MAIKVGINGFGRIGRLVFRNLAAMETEEMIRAQPMDAVVLLGGCDKTVPAQLMAAASANIPTIMVVRSSVVERSHSAGISIWGSISVKAQFG